MSTRVIIHSFSSPEMNLAAEEYFFYKKNKENDMEEILRVWESNVFFIVLGSSQSVSEETFIDRCISNGVKILRRCSAGGAVLQGPGCINFSLFLSLDKYPQLRNIRESYHFILSSLRKTLKEIFQLNTSIEGICDLCFNGKKISGNAQRRNSKTLLHHGTMLYKLDYDLLENVLKIPKTQPNYRGGRDHKDFVGVLPLTKNEIIECILKSFTTNSSFSSFTEMELKDIEYLAQSKYCKDEWNFKR